MMDGKKRRAVMEMTKKTKRHDRLINGNIFAHDVSSDSRYKTRKPVRMLTPGL